MNLEQSIIVAVVSASLALIFNSLIQLLKTYFESRLNNKTFQREQALIRLQSLYLDIYKTIIQSEYVRYFYNKYDNKNFDPIEFPFLEISMSKKTVKFGSKGFSEEIQEVSNDITQEKKDKIIDKILENPQYASAELLKLATAYRYVYHYSQRDNLLEEIKNNIDEEELKLSRLLVMTIIKETNSLSEICSFPIDGKELSYGLFNHTIFERDRI